jgi:hypothetical protein
MPNSLNQIDRARLPSSSVCAAAAPAACGVLMSYPVRIKMIPAGNPSLLIMIYFWPMELNDKDTFPQKKFPLRG